jgi:deoxyribodipyrimidine photolyase-related protein
MVVMAGVDAEIRPFPNHKQRVALFLSAMRHFRDELRGQGFRVRYQTAEDQGTAGSFPEALAKAIDEEAPDEEYAKKIPTRTLPAFLVRLLSVFDPP